MTTPLSPIVSEFESVEQEAAYLDWLKAKVQASLDDPRPAIPHDQAMAQIESIILAAEKRKKSA